MMGTFGKFVRKTLLKMGFLAWCGVGKRSGCGFGFSEAFRILCFLHKEGSARAIGNRHLCRRLGVNETVMNVSIHAKLP
jgi:hypothetical protein